tara:strand:- start:372 stop:647 length:276 start_codon:yes stop_codon:yes gene_type:complete
MFNPTSDLLIYKDLEYLDEQVEDLEFVGEKTAPYTYRELFAELAKEVFQSVEDEDLIKVSNEINHNIIDNEFQKEMKDRSLLKKRGECNAE